MWLMKSCWECNGARGILQLASVASANIGKNVFMFLVWFTSFLLCFFSAFCFCF